MSDLIEALTIFLKYGNPSRPTCCEHDTPYIAGINPADVSQEDKARLDELGFFVDEDEFGDTECFYSFRFGAA